jgi:hypothetical protein
MPQRTVLTQGQGDIVTSESMKNADLPAENAVFGAGPEPCSTGNLTPEVGISALGDHLHLTSTAMERITGIHRQQWLRWADAGMPRNADGSWSLPAVISWIRGHPRKSRPRKYHGQPAAIGKRIGQRVAAMIESELVAFEYSRPKQQPILDKGDQHDSEINTL